MQFSFDEDLREIADKVEDGERLSFDDGVSLYATSDLNALGKLADHVRRKKHGLTTFYNVNRHFNHTNICVADCKFCGFYKRARQEGAYTHSIQEGIDIARDAVNEGATELHIVGGLHPTLKFDYYTDMLKRLRALDSRLQLKCFTAIEILHLAWLARKSVTDTLRELKSAGLDSLTGGGAEIFRKEVRSAIARGKESGEEYLDVHRTWHKMGGRSTCTMLFGHVESLPDRVDHLRQLRQLQDETHGFVGFVPLPYQPENNAIPVETPPTGFDTLRTVAVSRIYLDNFDHITAYWVGMGLKLAQVALSYGADDLHGTIIEEHIFHMAGASSPQLQTETEMVKAIREAGREPVQRNTFYEPLKIWNGQTKTNAAEAEAEPGANSRAPVLENNLATA